MDKKAYPTAGMGIPDPTNYGDFTSLEPGLYPYVVQLHNAIRAKKHNDLRLGAGRMFSWAVPKLVPEDPKTKRLAIQQPQHTQAYMHYQGPLTGYGAGTVKTQDKGSALVTKVTDHSIHYTVAHKGQPQRFVLQKLEKGKDWLLINVTPSEALLHGKPPYKQVPAEEVETLFNPNMSIEAKIDGARVLGKIFKDKIELLSYRISKDGKPIVHTERFFGSKAQPRIKKKDVGTEFVGEMYGVRKGKAIPVQELSGVLNSSLENALKAKEEKDIQLRLRIFDILKQQEGLPENRLDTLKRIEELAGNLGEGFEATEAVPGEKGLGLWTKILKGKHPLTSEGIVAWPIAGGVPTKATIRPEHNVYIRGIFPEAGNPDLAGGFTYSNEPDGTIVGRVGTGFNQDMKAQMIKNQKDWLGRKARITSKGQFGSGAHRAPAFIALDEGYPEMKKTAYQWNNYASPQYSNYGGGGYDMTQMFPALMMMQMMQGGGMGNPFGSMFGGGEEQQGQGQNAMPVDPNDPAGIHNSGFAPRNYEGPTEETPSQTPTADAVGNVAGGVMGAQGAGWLANKIAPGAGQAAQKYLPTFSKLINNPLTRFAGKVAPGVSTGVDLYRAYKDPSLDKVTDAANSAAFMIPGAQLGAGVFMGGRILGQAMGENISWGGQNLHQHMANKMHSLAGNDKVDEYNRKAVSRQEMLDYAAKHGIKPPKETPAGAASAPAPTTPVPGGTTPQPKPGASTPPSGAGQLLEPPKGSGSTPKGYKSQSVDTTARWH